MDETTASSQAYGYPSQGLQRLQESYTRQQMMQQAMNAYQQATAGLAGLGSASLTDYVTSTGGNTIPFTWNTAPTRTTNNITVTYTQSLPGPDDEKAWLRRRVDEMLWRGK